MVMGRNANGLTEWKNIEGNNLREYETGDKIVGVQITEL